MALVNPGLSCRFGCRGQKGLALVEFVVLLPVALFLMFATAELGRALYQHNALYKSVQAGARHIADFSEGTSGVLVLDPAEVQAARNIVVFGNRAGSGEPIAPGLEVADVSIAIVDSRFIRVDLTYEFQPVFAPLPDFGLGDGDDIGIGPFSVETVVRGLQ